MPTSAAVARPARPSAARRARRWLAEQALVGGIVVAVFLGWELGVAALRVPPFILPPPSQIVRHLISARGLLLEHTWVTVTEVLAGFGLAVPSACAGRRDRYSRIFEKVAYTFIVPLRPFQMALAPLVVLWFGYGLLPKMLVAC